MITTLPTPPPTTVESKGVFDYLSPSRLNLWIKCPLEITHEVQFSCYAYLFRHMAGQTEAGLEIRSLIKTKTPKIELHRYAPRTDIHFRRLFALIRAYLDELHAGRFVYRPGWTCSMCDYRDTHCRLWQA